MSAVSLSVAQLLNEAQRGAASAHVRYAKMLWELATSDAVGTADQLLTAFKFFATVAEVGGGGAAARWCPQQPLPCCPLQTTPR